MGELILFFFGHGKISVCNLACKQALQIREGGEPREDARVSGVPFCVRLSRDLSRLPQYGELARS